MKLYAGIVRVSHMGERKAGAENVHTDRDQVAAVKEALPPAARLEILPHELDVSGGLPLAERPSLLAAVEGVESGRYAGIIVAYQSRLFRNVEEEEAVWRRVEAADGEVLLALDGIDASTANGRMMRRFKAVMNQGERELHAERFERLRESATEAGIWQRRQTPRGYCRGSDRRLSPDRRAPQVRRAFADYLAGASISELARRLRMTTSGVRQLLRNRVYLGELRVGRYVNPDAHPALIDVETFERVQRKLAEGVRPGRRGRPPALLAGLVRCPSCGHTMSRSADDKRARAYYVCRGQHSGERCPAPAGIVAETLESHVERIALAELERLQVEASASDRVAGAQAAVREAERKAMKYAEAIEPEDIGAEAYRAGAVKRRQAVEAAKDALAVELARQPARPTVGGGAEVWADLDAHERNLLLRSLFAVVLVDPVGRGRKVPVAERVRVLAYGSDIPELPHRDHRACGIVPIPFPDADAVGVLGIPAGEDLLEAAGSAA